MTFLKEQYQRSFAFLREELRGDLRNTALAFLIIALIAYVVCLFSAAAREALMIYIQNVIDSAEIVTDDNGFSALRIFENNVRAAAFSALYGLIPLLYLPALPIGLNAAVLGATAAVYQVQGTSLLLYAAALIPHGIFEFPALFVAFALGLYLCRDVTGRLMNRHSEETPPSFSKTAGDVFCVFCTVVLPLLFVAALVEAYVTPVIASFFL